MEANVAIAEQGTVFTFNPPRRHGTKTLSDIPLERRKQDLESPAALLLKSLVPLWAWESFETMVLSGDIYSQAAKRWFKYATSLDENGQPVSPIARWASANPYNPISFKVLYGLEDAKGIDKVYIMTSGADAIYQRLMSIIDRLPDIILSERKRLGLGPDEKYVIANVGAAYGLDTIFMMAENLELQGLVEIIHVDPDEESLDCGRRLAENLGVEECFKFIPKKMQEAAGEIGIGKVHMLLFIGMFCPIPTPICQKTLSSLKNFLAKDGIVIFSTVQEEMLLNLGAVLDAFMWAYGWTMFFKEHEEPGKIAQSAGLVHEKGMDWEDSLGYNRMTVARRAV